LFFAGAVVRGDFWEVAAAAVRDFAELSGLSCFSTAGDLDGLSVLSVSPVGSAGFSSRGMYQPVERWSSLKYFLQLAARQPA